MAFMPKDTLYNGLALEATLVLICIISRKGSTDSVARNIRRLWRQEGKFQIHKANAKSYIIGF